METTIPADLLLVRGTCIVNESMLSGESTPLLKESIDLWVADACTHKTTVLFSSTKVPQLSLGEPACTPDGGCLAVARWLRKQCLQQEVSPSWAQVSLDDVFYSYLI